MSDQVIATLQLLFGTAPLRLACQLGPPTMVRRTESGRRSGLALGAASKNILQIFGVPLVMRLDLDQVNQNHDGYQPDSEQCTS